MLGQEQSESGVSEETADTFSDADFVVYLQRTLPEDEQRLAKLENSAEGLTQLFESISKNASKRRTEVMSDDDTSAASSSEEMERQADRIEDPGVRAKLEIVLQRRQASERQERVVSQKLSQQRKLLKLVMLGEEPAVLEEDGSKREEPQPVEATEKDSSSTSAIDLLVPTASVVSKEKSASSEESDTNNTDSIEEVKAKNELARRIEAATGLSHELAMVDRLIALEEADLSLAELLSKASQRGHELVENAISERQGELAALDETQGTERDAYEKKLSELQVLLERISEVREGDEQLVQTLSYRLSTLALFRSPLLDRVSEAEISVEKARFRLTLVQSPFAPHNIKKWFISSGPKLLIIVAIFVLAWIVAQGMARRLFMRTVRKSGYGSEAERMERVDTIVRVFKNAVTILIFGLGLIAILPEFGVDLTVLLGGAAVISLAVAFGAQTLVKDYFSGIMILLENQYRVGNVIRLNDITGLVEDVSLRVTMLRDLDGIAHFIPHGQITSVSNLSHGWSRAVFDIGVAYKENVDRVIEVLKELAKEMRNDFDFGPYIVEDAEMLGVDKLSDSAVVIRFIVKTRPLKQFLIRREMLRRIKNRFDELGIEIPFPHRTVYHRGYEAGPNFEKEDEPPEA